MKIQIVLTAAVLFLLSFAATALGQQEKVIYTSDGDKYRGAVQKEDGKFIEIKIKGGIATIPVSAIERIVDVIQEAKLQYLVVHDKELGDRLHQELRYGADFTKLVRDYSEDISLFKDGITAYVDKTYLAENVSSMAFRLAKGNYTAPVKVGEAWYIVKVLDKREVEKEPEKPPQEEPANEGQGEEKPAEEPEKQDNKIRIAILPSKEETREAKVGAMGSYVQEILVSEISKTTGLEAYAAAEAPKSDDKDAPDFVISGLVATQEPVHALQFVLKNSRGKELYTTERLTAICSDDIENLIGAIKAHAEALIREMKKPR